MKIEKLLQRLTTELHDKFGKFSTLLEEFKTMNNNKEDNDLIEKHYKKMTKVALELEPIMHMVSFIDPQRREMEKYILQCIRIHNYGKKDNVEVLYDGDDYRHGDNNFFQNSNIEGN